MSTKRKLRYGMPGGGQNTFIGAVQRITNDFDGKIKLVIGTFSKNNHKQHNH